MNSSFLRRLKFYGIGFGIGCIFVIFFFQNRGCSWLPENRVKNSILDRVIVANDLEWEFMQSKGITKDEIMSVLNDGDVDFGKSKKDGETQVYIIEKEFENIGFTRLYFTLPKESFISEVRFGEKYAKNVNNTTEGLGRFIHFPKDDYLAFPDTTAHVKCQQQQFKLLNNKALLKKIKSNGFIDFSKTDFSIRPKAEHCIAFISGKDTIRSKSIWYQNKINISTFYLPFSNPCDSLSQPK